jgi:nucleoid-associated protein YgaU
VKSSPLPKQENTGQVLMPRIVSVLPGDSIQKIARRYYGDSSNWKNLVNLNQLSVQSVTVNGQLLISVHIVPGQKLRLY